MVIYQQQQNWGRLVLSQPHTKNKLSLALIRNLSRTLDELAERPPDRLSIESASADIFAAGADIQEILALDGTSAQAYAAEGQALMNRIESFPVPVYALVAGPCFGGALDLVLSCRHLWVADNALFCHPGAYRGLVTGFGGTVRASRRMHPMLARLILTTGYRFSGRDALAWGLADRLFVDQCDMLATMACM